MWDRLEIPQEQADAAAFENTIGFRGPTFFTRTTDGGASWEEARMIFDPGQENQTIGNQIAVLPDNADFEAPWKSTGRAVDLPDVRLRLVMADRGGPRRWS